MRTALTYYTFHDLMRLNQDYYISLILFCHFFGFSSLSLHGEGVELSTPPVFTHAHFTCTFSSCLRASTCICETKLGSFYHRRSVTRSIYKRPYLLRGTRVAQQRLTATAVGCMHTKLPSLSYSNAGGGGGWPELDVSSQMHTCCY